MIVRKSFTLVGSHHNRMKDIAIPSMLSAGARNKMKLFYAGGGERGAEVYVVDTEK